MKVTRIGLWTCTLGLVLLVGCSRESNKGGPGADKGKPAPGTPAANNPPAGGERTPGATDRDHFTVKVPSGNTNVTQGERKEVTVTIDRDGKFDQEVTLKFEPPAGIKVEPASVSIPKGKDEARVTIHATPEAKVGTTNVAVTGTAASGGPPAKVEMGVEVKAKK
jgi:hypothetical protein